MKEAPTRGERAGAESDGALLNTATLPDPATASELNSLSGDTEAAVAFLDHWCPGGPWVLTSIVPDGGKTTTATFAAPTLAQMRRWIDARQGRQNIYFTVNVVFGEVEVKPNKGAIAAIRALHVDVDPRVGEEPAAERERALKVLRAYDPAPTVIVDSGGGMQGFWLVDGDVDVGGSRELSELFRRIEAGPALTGDEQGLVEAHLARLAEVEARNLKVETDLQADACHNADRIMRLPGTVNVPGEKKRSKGRVARLATVVDADWSRRYALARFAKAKIGAGSGPAVSVTAAPATGLTLADLPPAVSDRTKAVIVQGDDPDSPNADRSRVVFGVVCDLVRAGCSDEQMLWVILNPDHKISAHVLEQKGTLKYARRQVAQARAAVAESGSSGDDRPQVIYDENRLPDILDAAEGALLASGIPIYQMAGRLVHSIRLDASEDDDGVQRRAGALLVRDVNAHRIREYMTGAANFVKQKVGPKGVEYLVGIAPPLSFAHTYIAREGAWRLPVLRGVTETPTLRPDGTVLAVDGYDAGSRLILDTRGVVFPAVPDRPSRDDALAAMATLKAVIGGFPFVDDAARSVALSAILTAVSRRAVRTAPLHGFSAPTMGTGKSLLADVVSMVATGRDAVVMSQGASEEEDEKRLLSVLMQCDPVLVIDNIKRPVEGDALCSILTSETWKGRQLGLNRLIAVSTATLIIATGNNIEFRGDMSTRAILCSMDAKVERPEARRYDVDLRVEVPRRQGELVAAALTVLRAFVVAGRPGARDLEPFGRFEEWSDLVRGALVWAGEADPCDSRANVAGGDSAREELAVLVDAWRVAVGVGKPVTAAGLIDAAGHPMGDRGGDEGLRQALEAACPNRLTPKALGRYLGKMQGRIALGLRVERIENVTKDASTTYVLARVNG